MTSEQFDNWIKALESGDYRQGQNALYDQRVDGYCCLGVLHCTLGNTDAIREVSGVTVVSGEIIEGNDGGAGGFYDELGKLGLTLSLRHELAGMNDSGQSFQDIATFLREQAPELVTG